MTCTRTKPTEFFLLECTLGIDAKPIFSDAESTIMQSLGIEKHWHIVTDEYIIKTNQMPDHSPSCQIEIFLRAPGIRIIGVNAHQIIGILEHNHLRYINYGPLTARQSTKYTQHSSLNPYRIYDGVEQYYLNHPIVWMR